MTRGRHRPAGPPYPVGPAVREQGAAFWLRFAGCVVLAVVFVVFFAGRAWLAVDQHAEDIRVHEQHIER